MATVSLKIALGDGSIVKTMQFDPSTTVYDACKILREKILEANLGEPKDYGLFLTSDDDTKKGVWLEPSRTLDYYMLRNGDMLYYNRKLRNLRVRMLDGTVKTLLVDDSQIVANLMVVICTKIGITNYDEYGLVREEPKEEQDATDGKPNYGTLTLKRKNAEKERDAKMEQLRKKLRTDDEVNWVDPSKTLREQGIDPTETVLLRRKFFFSDRNVDGRDPVQLNLLYVQARDAILDGTHPITQDKACEFAGIQCQIQFGDYKEDKHTPGFLDLKEFLPSSYSKVKGIEKKIFKEHRKHIGLSELDAKVLYTKSARSLSTYGVAFFLVKEKMKGKNKLVPRLLGVTKDSVLRLDEKTKEILQTWPLTTVRRWCASPNTFTLDFGDYSDQYYSVQTTEAEQILQVIAGYIDIILKKQKAKEHFGIEGDEGSAMLEDSVSPNKAQILQHDSIRAPEKIHTESLAKPAVVRDTGEGGKPYVVTHTTGAQQTTITGQITIGHTPPTTTHVQQSKVTTIVQSEPQRALLSTIKSGREVIRMTEMELTRAQIPDIGSDAASLKWKESQVDSNRQAVTSHIAAMNAATAQVVTLTSAGTEDVDHSAVGAAITTITTNLPEMTKGVQMLAALMEDQDNGDRLLDATRHLCTAFSDLLTAAEPETKEPRQTLLNAASKVGEASTKVLYTIGEETTETKEVQEILLSMAKSVATATAGLVLKAKNVSAACREDQQCRERVIAAATQCALATSQLVACARVVASTLHNPVCREQLTDAARHVSRSVETLLSECNSASASTGQGRELMSDLTRAATDVSEALNRLMAHINYADRRPQTVTETSVESIMLVSEQLLTAPQDSTEMVRQARRLGQATAHLIQSIKVEAESQSDSEQQRRLLAAAKLLADATARMVEAARQCASEPQDRSKQEALRKAAEEVRYVTADYAAGHDIGAAQIHRLKEAAKQASSSATQLITSAQNAATFNTNKYSQETLFQECQLLSESLPRLVEAVRSSNLRPDAPSAQLQLITASEQMLQTSGHVSQASRAVLPTVNDVSTSRQLSDTTQQFVATCTELRTAVNRARTSCKGLELDASIEMMKSLKDELIEVERAAGAYELRPLPGDTAESAASQLASSSRLSSAAVSNVSWGASRGDVATTGRAASDGSAALADFTKAVRAVAATSADTSTRNRIISSGKEVITKSIMLIETVKRYLNTNDQVDGQYFDNLAKDVHLSLEQTLEAVPSHKELDITIENINETLNILDMGEFPPTDRTFGQLQQELTSAAEGLNAASSEVVENVEQTPRLVDSSVRFGDAFNQMLGVSMEIAGQTQELDVRRQMVESMRSLTSWSSRLLTTAKSVAHEPHRPNARNELASAARAVTDAINQLVDVCLEAAPGQKECDRAVRSIQSCGPMLQSPMQPVNDLTYFGCLDMVVDHSKTLSEGMSGMANAAKNTDHDQFTRSVRTVADSICALVECTAQASYLVAVSDENSVAGRPGLVDQAQFARAAHAIQMACDTLCKPDTSKQQIMSAATGVARHTSVVCNACRSASNRTTDATDKRRFVHAAKDVANCTAALVTQIKALDQNESPENRDRIAAATTPLRQAIQGLVQFANSPEFASVPAKISPQGRKSQEVILENGRNIIRTSCGMVEAARDVCGRPDERSTWQGLAHHSKELSDHIKSLVNNIRDKAPGQRECLAALETLNSQIRAVDQASLQALDQTLTPRKANSLQGYSEQIENTCTEIVESIEPLRTAAKSEAENLGHTVIQLVSYLEPLVQASIGAASNITESTLQMSIMEQCKTVLEGATQLVLASKDSAGNPRAIGAHTDVEESSVTLRTGAGELSASIRQLATSHGLVAPLLDSIGRATQRLTHHRMSLVGTYDINDCYVDYQTRMVAAAKEIARLSTEMTAKSANDSRALVPLASELSSKYEQLAHDALGAAATSDNADNAHRIRTTVVELGDAATCLIKAGGSCQPSTDEISHNAKKVNEKACSVLAALQAGSAGTQACIDAASTVSSIIADLDTTILFASAGTLQCEKPGDKFSEHREDILRTAKTLVDETKVLVSAAAATQEQLAHAARSCVNEIVQLAEVVKEGAVSLGGSASEPQVMLLNAVRDVAAALRDLIHTTKDASGKNIAHPVMTDLRDSARNDTTSKRWSLPTAVAGTNKNIRRRSINASLKYDSACDSETDWFVSDQEDELLKLVDYTSSQDDEISPSVIEEITGEKPVSNTTDINSNYNKVQKYGVVDMTFRIVKYGESILTGEIYKLCDITNEIGDREEERLRNENKVNDDLELEMKRLSQFIEEVDLESLDKVGSLKNAVSRTIRTEVTVSKQLNGKSKTQFKNKKPKPSKLVINICMTDKRKTADDIIKAVSNDNDYMIDLKGIKDLIDEKITYKPDKVKEINNKISEVDENANELRKSNENLKPWESFKEETDYWKDMALKKLKENEETRHELERFSNHELVIGDYENQLNKYQEEKQTLQGFIDDIEMAQTVDKSMECDENYNNVIKKLKSIRERLDNAKITIPYKGFDPIIDELTKFSNLKFSINKFDVSKYTYEELCALEKFYKDFVDKFEDRSPSLEKEAPKYPLKRNLAPNNLNATPNSEYYSNDWWKIYEDIIKTRERQFGTIDKWWNYYEAILKKDPSNEQELERIRAVVEHRRKNRESRCSSRTDELLKSIDEINNNKFTESVDVNTDQRESVMVTNVTSLLKIVKSVEDEHTRGTRALESTVEAISQEIRVLQSAAAPLQTATPEELVRVTRQMTVATAKSVAAGKSDKQEHLTAAANLGRKTVADMLAVCKGAAYKAETSELRERTIAAGQHAAVSYRELLQAILRSADGDQSAKQQFPDLSKKVARCVADILAIAEQLKGSDWVDPDDPTVIAENELLGAAASIDAAANKLAALRPRKSIKEADENLNFDEMILEAAKSIIIANSALVRAATAAQRELIDQGKVARRPVSSSDDGQWSEGLISAARLVAAATHTLVEAANALVQGLASEERLISSAKQVASSTAQLLVACKVKADPTSESTRRLQNAGAEVIRSTDNLVKAARGAITSEDERCLVLNTNMVGGIAQEIDARSEVLRIEKELDEARGRLNAIRQARHKLRGNTDSDTDGYISDSSTKIRHLALNDVSFGQNSSSSSYNPETSHYTTYDSLTGQGLNSSFNTTGGQKTEYRSTTTLKYGQPNGGSNYQSVPVMTPEGPAKGVVDSPTFSSFRPAAEDTTPKQNYEAFTTRCETRLYDIPRPIKEFTTRSGSHETHQPMFNAHRLKQDECVFKPITGDGFTQNFYETKKSSEKIPGGLKTSEFTVKSESYQSYPRELKKTEFFTSTPSRSYPEKLAKESPTTPTPKYSEERTTEVKDIPNGTQEIMTTKIYSSSPVNLSTTLFDSKPIQLDGIDQLSKSLDSTADLKVGSEIGRSFMRPSQFHSEIQTNTGVSNKSDHNQVNKKLLKQNITAERIEKKTVTTSSHKQETSSTVTKKFGNA